MAVNFRPMKSETSNFSDDVPYIKPATYNVCCLFHGLNGDPKVDWETWVDILHDRFPDWHVHTMKSYKTQAAGMGEGLDWISVIAAEEVKDVVGNIRASDHTGADPNIVLHCIGHSMGGVIIRGMLPELEEMLGQDMPELGHYMSLSSPHLGTQASWMAPHHNFRNLGGLLATCSILLPQLSIQDKRIPYMVQISANRYLEVLARFRTRTCVGLSVGDPLIALPSATIDHENEQTVHRYSEPSFWCFDRLDIETGTPFESLLGEDQHREFFESCPEDKTRAGGRFGFSDTLCWCLEGLRLWLGTILMWLFCVPCVWFRVFVNRQRGPAGNVFKELQAAPPPRRFSVTTFGTHANKSSRTLESMRTFDVLMIQQKSMPILGHGGKSFAIEEPPKALTNNDPHLEWVTSQDKTNVCPKIVLDALSVLQWQRITVNYHRPCRGAKNKHVFLIGKSTEQHADEHEASRQCIALLAEIFGDVEIEQAEAEDE